MFLPLSWVGTLERHLVSPETIAIYFKVVKIGITDKPQLR